MQLYLPTKVYSEENCVVKHAKELSALGTKAMIVTGKLKNSPFPITESDLLNMLN